MDPLSDMLSLLKPRSHVSAGFHAGGDWSIQFSDLRNCIKCYAVVSGECWLSVEGLPDAVRLKAGDCFVLPSGRPFRIASDLALTPIDAGTLLLPAQDGGVASLNGGGTFSLVGSRFAVSGDQAGILSGMPPIVHIRREADQAALRWSVEQMMRELRERQPGGVLVARHLAHMMLVQVLRAHLEDGVKGGVGWFFALADRQMSAAINAMHADPARGWTLRELAGRAGMSRSTFAAKFRETVGTTPMEYLTRWRMLLAGDRLANSGDPISLIAQSLGYRSESAFSTAFKRAMGRSPREHSRTQNPAFRSQREGEGTDADRLEPPGG